MLRHARRRLCTAAAPRAKPAAAAAAGTATSAAAASSSTAAAAAAAAEADAATSFDSKSLLELVQFGGLVVFVQNYVLSITQCIGPSMLPTIGTSGDVVVMWPAPLGRLIPAVRPRVGDVVISTSPVDASQTVCKRVLGMPGDSVRVAPTSASSRVVTVPAGHMWLQGDNVSDSTDSRYYGPVPLALLQGVVFLKVWPQRTLLWGPLARRDAEASRLRAEEAAARDAAARRDAIERERARAAEERARRRADERAAAARTAAAASVSAAARAELDRLLLRLEEDDALTLRLADGGGDEAEAALRAALREVREALNRAEAAVVVPPQSSSRRGLEEGTV